VLRGAVRVALVLRCGVLPMR